MSDHRTARHKLNPRLFFHTTSLVIVAVGVSQMYLNIKYALGYGNLHRIYYSATGEYTVVGMHNPLAFTRAC
jgi:hypothetical protein